MTEFELKEKYERYCFHKSIKKVLVNEGKTAFRDSQMNKFYNAEFSFVKKEIENPVFANIEEAQKFVNKVTKSNVWKQLNKTRCNDIVIGTTKQDCHACATYGEINFNLIYPIDMYTVLHELAHCAGHMDHDVGFRICLMRLIQRFMGKEHLKIWKQTMKESKIKLRFPSTEPKSYEDWKKSYEKCMVMRKASA